MRQLSYIITKEQADMSIERLLLSHYAFTRRQLSRLKFQENGIQVNGVRQRVTYRLQENDRLTLTLSSAPFIPTSDDFSRVPLRILYESADAIALQKPSGMTLHPSHGHYYDTLVVQLNAWLKEQGRPASLHVIGRLDRDTSGIVLLAKNPLAAQRFDQQRKEGVLQKTYTALVHGKTPLQGTLRQPLRPKPHTLNRMEIHPQGKACCTHYRCIAQNETASLLSIRLESGRTHQIRVHLSAVNHPLYGDPFYGKERDAARLCLHAGQLWFIEPFSKEPVFLEYRDDTLEAIIRQTIG